MELIKNIAAVLGLLSTALGLTMAIFKPLRQSIANSFANKSIFKTLVDDVKDIKIRQDEAIKIQNEAIVRLDRVEKNVLDNESERLKSDLFACGNRCRRGIYLYPEEFSHIREVYDRYSNVLHKNHDGTQEYNFIYDYYNKQQLNNKTN